MLARILLPPLLSLVAFTTLAQAQCAEADSVLVGVITAVVAIPAWQANESWADLVGPDAEQDCHAIQHGLLWATPTGVVIFGLTETIVLNDSCVPLNSISAPWLFGQLSHELARQAVLLGFVSCAAVGDSATSISVEQSACVDIVLDAGGDGYRPCGSDITSRRFATYCPVGTSSPAITLVEHLCRSCETVEPACTATCTGGVPDPQ
jgi:hypothetical protein